MGVRHAAGPQCLSKRRRHRGAGRWGVAWLAPTPARVALRWGRQRRPLSAAAGWQPVLCAAAPLGARVVAGECLGLGPRRHRPRRTRRRAGGERPRPRQCDPRGVARVAGQPAGRLEAAPFAPAAPAAAGGAPHHAGDVLPERVGVCWSGLRVWIALGFRALTGVGWPWQQTRPTEPLRVARHWLVLAVATFWGLAYGTRVEEAAQQGGPPARLRTPPPAPAHSPSMGGRQRLVRLLRLGLSWLRTTLGRGYLWHRLWLTPEPWPASLPPRCLTYHLVASPMMCHQYLPL